jgi:hypothetical protein
MPTLPPPKRFEQIRFAGLIAVLGACIGMTGDLFLLYSPDGGYEAGDFEFLRGIDNGKLLIGHYLGILGIPLEVAGIWVIGKALEKMGRKTANLAMGLGLYLMFLGVAYHGTVYPLGNAVRAGDGSLEIFRPFSEPLGLVFALLFFLGILALTIAIFRGKTYLPRSYGLASPLVSYPLCLLAYVLLPALGNFLAPMGFNLSMAIFIGVLGWNAEKWNWPEKQSSGQ